MADDVLKQFVLALGFDVKSSDQARFEGAITSAVVKANLATEALLKVAESAAKFAANIIASFDQLYYASARTGASVQNIKALQYAFTQVGGSAQSAVSAIEAFAKAQRTNPGVKQYVDDLGIKRSGDAVTDLMASIDKIREKHPYYAGAQMAGLLGISEEQFNLFDKNSEKLKAKFAEINQLRRTFGVDSEKTAKQSAAFSAALGTLSNVVEVAGERLTAILLPSLEKVTGAITGWLNAHPELIATIFNMIGTAVDLASKAFGFLIDKGGELFKFLGDRASAMNEDGSFLRMWEKVAAVFDRIVRAIQGMITWLKEIDRATDTSNGLKAIGRLLGWVDGSTSGAVQSGLHTIGAIDQGTDSGVGVPGEKGKPGVLKRGWEAARRMVGMGASASDASGGVSRNGGGKAEGARESYTFWRGKGLTHEQAAGLVGMEQGESQFNPNARGDSGLAHGAFQHHPDRRAAILRGTGIDISNSTHQQQLEATHWEMTKGGERGFWDRIQQAKTAGEAAATGVKYFERPRDIPGESRLRGQYANSWAARFAGSPVVQPQAPQTPTLNFPKFNIPKSFDVNALTATPALGGAVDNSSSRSVTQTINNNVKIDGGGDPAAAANHMERVLGRTSETSLRNAQTAIR